MHTKTEPNEKGRFNCYGTAIGDQAGQSFVLKMARGATIQMVMQLEVISMIAGELTKNDKLISSIETFVKTTVRQKAKKV